MQSADELPPYPERVGPYRIESRLGIGGMGAVYRAYDQRLERPVAIKHILPDVAEDTKARERLRREAFPFQRDRTGERSIRGVGESCVEGCGLHLPIELGVEVVDLHEFGHIRRRLEHTERVRAMLTDPDFRWLAAVLLVLGLILLIILIAQMIDLFEALAGWWAVKKHEGLIEDLSTFRSASVDELGAVLERPRRSAVGP